MFHVVLYEPEIPPNTGNIIRLCANSGAELHLVKPLGFRLDDKSLQRSGLDYHDLALLTVHANFDACVAKLLSSRWFAIETGGRRRYSEVKYSDGDVLLFGPETRGLPKPVLERVGAAQCLSVPMRASNRSMNLSNTVALVLYEAWRQCDFRGAKET